MCLEDCIGREPKILMSGRQSKPPVPILVLKEEKHVPGRRSSSPKYFQEVAGYTQSSKGERKRQFQKVSYHKEPNNNRVQKGVFVSNRVPYIVVHHCEEPARLSSSMENGSRNFHKSFSAPNLRKNIIGSTLRR